MGLFNVGQMDLIDAAAAKSKAPRPTAPKIKTKDIQNNLKSTYAEVEEYFKDANSILITSKEQLHEYVDNVIAAGYAGIDTETTGLDRYNDHIVGASLYYPGGIECYIPMKHLVPIFDVPYDDQLPYEEVQQEFQRIADSDTRLIFANADFDLAMIYNHLHVDLVDRCYYDVILAWRCLKEDEKDNSLKALYNKYCLKGKGNPKKFSDFFSPTLFPYCKPEIAKLYAANDAKITYELFKWQLPFTMKDHPKCQKAHLEAIADIIWNVEFPLIKVCQSLNRTGFYMDKRAARAIKQRYDQKYKDELAKLQIMVQQELDNCTHALPSKRPFYRGSDFNPNSVLHVKFILCDVMNVLDSKSGTGKEILKELNNPLADEILAVRSLDTLISTFVDKLPKSVTPDGRIHAEFKQIGADTGRFSSANPNLQNIPSRASDIRHMFRATPGYVLLGSDFSQQEPRLTAFLGNDEKMIQSFIDGKDIYASIASAAFGVPYENCLEFHPKTHEYQPEGKARRSEAKTILLGVTYGRSIPSIAEQLYNHRDDMTEEQKVKGAQKVYDAVMNSFSGLRDLMFSSQQFARKHGYVETMLGRRRHLPDMKLPEFEFRAMQGYVNPDVDPLDISTLENRSSIPDRIVKALEREFSGYKYFGQIAKRTKELYAQKIRVINNRPKINDATRQCVNSRVQGSAADMTKIAMLKLYSSQEFRDLGARLLVPVHDEILVEVPEANYKRASELLASLMSSAGDFLPFTISCDVEVSYRWYGMEYPCPYTQPKSLLNMSEDEIKWVQYHLVECEYELPILPDKDGNKPIGDAAHGVNGVITEEMLSYIKDYETSYGLTDDTFIEHIFNRVNSDKF